MQISIDKKIFETTPAAKVGCLVIKGIKNSEVSDNKLRNTYELLSAYTNTLKGEEQRLSNKQITSWDHTLERFDLDTDKIQASHKSLVNRAAKKGELPDINPVVNLYNLVSIKNLIPIGGHDMSKTKSVRIGFTNGDETFRGIGDENDSKVNQGELGYIDDEAGKVLTRNLVWRQSATNMLDENSTDIFFPIDDFPGNLSNQELDEIAKQVVFLVTNLLGGEAFFGIADKSNSTLSTTELTPLTVKKYSDIDYILTKLTPVITDEQQIDEVLTKGMKEIFPTKEELKERMMKGERLKIYTGIDPTANFIHMGHMIWMKKLSEFQKLGHQIIFLIGGFTAMIGDPDKEYSRAPLTQEQVKANFENYRKDAAKILDFDNPDNPVVILNNYDWLSKIDLEQWLGIMSNVTMQHILSHDMFKKRIEEEKPIRLHEVMYPLMQGYDSVHMEVDLEIGGSDQTFNMLTGRILCRNITGKEKHVMTLKLLTDNSGKKMGKTTGNAISFKDGPNDVYGKIMSFSDEVLPLAYELLSVKTLKEIDKITSRIESDPMAVKKELAFEITELIHSHNDAKSAAEHFSKTIQNKEAPTDMLELVIADQSSNFVIDIIDSAKFGLSRSEIKRLIKANAVKLNDEPYTDPTGELHLNSGDIMKVGKRNWVKFI